MGFSYFNDITFHKLNPNWARVGLLPYYIDKNNIYILLGIYKVNDELFELCALSGGYKRTKENVFEGAIREFTEETENYFIDYEKDIFRDLHNSPILYSTGKNGIDRILFLIDLKKYIGECNIDDLRFKLQEHFKSITYPTELYSVDFIDINTFVNDKHNIKLYKDLEIFLKKNHCFKNNKLKNEIKYISTY